jgi:GNAT superfamily N-acetyltransferase
VEHVRFRTAFRAGDIGRIVRLHGEIYREEHGFDHTFEAYVAEHLGRFARETGPGHRIWIAEAGGSIVGTIAIADVGNGTAQLRWYVVRPEARGRGLGRELMTRALDFCRRRGFREVFLWTVDALDRARRVYDGHGFEPVEEITHPVWGAERTEQKMRLVLV